MLAGKPHTARLCGMHASPLARAAGSVHPARDDGIAAHRGSARHRHRESGDQRIDGAEGRRDIEARIAHRHRIARRRASCASVDRVMRRRNALPFASTVSMLHRHSIDDRRGRSTSLDGPLPPSRFIARTRIAVGRWRTPSHARSPNAQARSRLATGSRRMRRRHADMRRFRYRPRGSRF